VFTGIIEELGTVETGDRFSIGCRTVLSDLTPGASVSVNGVCLTAVDIRTDGFSADLAPETLQRSNLGDLRPGDRVNLERPLMLQTRLSGHIVQGHVDGTGVLEALRELGDGNWELEVRVPQDLDRFLVYKGSIAIDGISLTIASVSDGRVRVAIIPHTYEVTNLRSRKVGDRVNIECDVLAKHVDKLLAHLSLRT
jgi:riboflavin synthase